jgi:lysophospholipid acyltransferase (LPLAT)-like uncharacterized protein/tRNA U34 5-methylaminomethyl-2-thiouridine-forming methyltransferase MnmC
MEKKSKIIEGDYGNYHLQQTLDGSWTVLSDHFNETCHSTSGALTETLSTYILGCQVEAKVHLKSSKVPREPLRVFEMGFGIAQAFHCTTQVATQLKYLAIERDLKLCQWGLGHYQFSNFTLKKLKDFDLKYIEWKKEKKDFNQHLVILIGDAFVIMKNLKEILKLPQFKSFSPFEVIYQDAFSPLKNPVPWSVQWFSLLLALCDKDVRLATFSASSRVRKSMLKAGWAIHYGPTLEGKRPTTIGIIEGPSNQILLEKILKSPVEPINIEEGPEKSEKKMTLSSEKPIIQNRHDTTITFLSRLLYFFTCLLRWCYRFTPTPEGLANFNLAKTLHPKGGFIMCTWHELIIPSIFSQHGYPHIALTSASKDGEIVGQVLLQSGQTLVRGSSSKGGKSAREALINLLIEGRSLAISVDGPRGPRRISQPGVVDLARKTGVPILPMAVVSKNPWIFKKSWDQTQLPKIGAKIIVHFGKPFTIPTCDREGNPRLSETEFQETLNLVNEKINAAEKEALNFL